MSEQEYPKDYYRMPPLLSIPRPHRQGEVAANTNKTIFKWDCPAGHIGFVQRIANALAVGGYWRILFDNMAFRDDDRVVYVLGHINSPLELSPPIKVTKNILFIYYNESSKAVQIECLVDGVYGLNRAEWSKQREVT